MKRINLIVGAVCILATSSMFANIEKQKNRTAPELSYQKSLDNARQSSKHLALLRRQRTQLENRLSSAAKGLDELEGQRPALELERIDAMQNIAEVRSKMDGEKHTIAREIQRRAVLQSKLLKVEQVRTSAVAQAKMLYLKHYGNTTDRSASRSYNKALSRIKGLEEQIARLRSQLSNTQKA